MKSKDEDLYDEDPATKIAPILISFKEKTMKSKDEDI